MTERYPKDTVHQRVYRAFEALIEGDDDSIDLAEAALLIASMEYPDLDMARYLAELDALARRVRVLLALPDPDTIPVSSTLDPLVVINSINQVLFEEEHFRGNQQDYYNPNNSFLNKVLDDRIGIPITLSLLYMEIGRRVGLKVEGVGLPFHFVVRCAVPHGVVYVDPFEDGQLLSERDCRDRIRRIAQFKVKIHPRWFTPVGRRQLLIRLLNNLKKIYINNEEYIRSLSICDLVVLLAPRAFGELRDRGMIHFHLKHYSRALHDLSAYLDLAPDAEDRYEILNHVKSIRQIIAMLN